MSKLSIEFAGMKLKNPVIAASATPTKDHIRMRKCIEAGCGGLVAKTPSWDRLEQIYPSPRFYVFYPDGMRSGKFYSFYTNEQLCEYTPERYAEEIVKIRPLAEEHDCKIIGSIMASTDEEWTRMAEIYAPICDALELNLACPYGGELEGKKGCTVGADPVLVGSIINVLHKVTDKPLIAKLPAEGGDLTGVLMALDELKVAGVHTTHRYTGLEIDIETGKPIMHGAISGYGGPWQGPISRKWVARAAQLTKLDICGGGGVDGWRDSIAHMMAGAKAIQMCGGPSLRGYGYFTDTIKGIEKWLDSHGYESIEQIVGVAVPYIKHIREVPRKDVFKPLARVEEGSCSGCAECVEVCFYGAIEMDGKLAVIDQSICDGCGLCTQICATGAIKMYDGDKEFPTSWAGARGRKGEASRR